MVRATAVLGVFAGAWLAGCGGSGDSGDAGTGGSGGAWFEDAGIPFAFPTQTLHVKTDEPLGAEHAK